jgi:hypothetical protein
MQCALQLQRSMDSVVTEAAGEEMRATSFESNLSQCSQKRLKTMNASKRTRLNWILGASLVPVIYGLGGFASRIDAQTVASGVTARSMAGGTSPSQGAGVQDVELQQQVSAALHAQPYLDDRHIDTSVQGGVVVLSGIVFSGWDLEDALSTARKAAGARPVIDELSIEQEARR